MATHKPVLVDELSGELTPAVQPFHWQVAHTKPNCEKKLADYLKRLQITYYLPQMESLRLYQYRKVTFTKPMFPGYLFIKSAPEQHISLYRPGYIVRFLPNVNEAELLHDLTQIYLGKAHEFEIYAGTWLEQGWQVEIVSGAMQGVRGVVQDHKKLNEVTLQVNILRQAVTVRVNPADVKIISDYGNLY